MRLKRKSLGIAIVDGTNYSYPKVMGASTKVEDEERFVSLFIFSAMNSCWLSP